jgi:adenylosuccinate synthase
VLPGWLTDISAVNDIDALPSRAREFVSLVEREVGVPVKIVGTGAERESYVIWS